MAFPSNPTNGQQANVNGVVYTYNSTLTAWQVTTTFSGNVTVNQLSANAIVSTGNVGASYFTGTAVSVTGNITGGYILGNGSQISGLPASYSNANVATFLASYGSNVISTTGNITSSLYITSRSITGNLTIGSSTNSMAAGPITIADGVTVTVSSGGEWSIV